MINMGVKRRGMRGQGTWSQDGGRTDMNRERVMQRRGLEIQAQE